MAFTFISGVGNEESSSGSTINISTDSISVVANDLLVVGTSWGNRTDDTVVLTITDTSTGGITWDTVIESGMPSGVGGEGRVNGSWGIAPASETITINFQTGASSRVYRHWNVNRFGYEGEVTLVDSAVAYQGDSETGWETGQFTVQSGDLIVVMLQNRTSSVASEVPAGFSALFTGNRMESFYRIAPSAAANITVSADWADAATGENTTVVMVFRDSEGGDPGGDGATQLAFSSQPGNTVVGQIMSAFSVSALDAESSVDPEFVGNVTIAMEGDGVLGGTLTKAAVAGVATFNDIFCNTLNSGATIDAVADNLTAAKSSQFNITAGAGDDAVGIPSSSRIGGVIQ